MLVTGIMLLASNLASGQDKLTKFRFVHLEANGSQAAPFIAKEARVFEKNGLDVEIIRIGGGSRVIQAMLAGEIESPMPRRRASSRRISRARTSS